MGNGYGKRKYISKRPANVIRLKIQNVKDRKRFSNNKNNISGTDNKTAGSKSVLPIICGITLLLALAVFIFLRQSEQTGSDTDGNADIISNIRVSETLTAEDTGMGADTALSEPPADEQTNAANLQTAENPKPDAASEAALVSEDDADISENRGNTFGNISNMGSAAEGLEFIYYRSNDGGFLYRMKEDGSDRSLFAAANARYINVIDGWVYFKNIDDGGRLYRIRGDGTGMTKLNDEDSAYINVVGDWIYFRGGMDADDTEKFGRICKMRTDGSDLVMINDSWSNYITVAGDWIYYSNQDDEGRLYKIRTDGTGEQKLNDNKSMYINVSGGFIYYAGSEITDGEDVYLLYKIRTDGTERTLLSNENCLYVNVSGGWIYYNAGLNGMCKIKTDGTERTEIDSAAKDINVVGDWIYHYYDDGAESGYYKIKTNGTGRQKID